MVIDTDRGNWRLTGYYGYPNGGRRRASWDFLRTLSNQSALPWCIFGDFNDIMDANEKRGRTARSPWLINGFRQAVLDSGLSDVPVNGYRYTWFKYLGTPRAVEERLDRALANNDWFGLFPNAKLTNLVAPASDHYPIFLECSPVVRPHHNQRNFRFENAWKFEPGFNDFFTERWTTSGNDSVVTRLDRCAGDLSDWSRTRCNKLRKDIASCRQHLTYLRDMHTGSNQDQLAEFRRKLSQLMQQDDTYWRQRAKNHWYKDGDKNTKFFHASATARKKANRILSLKDDTGTKVTNIDALCSVAKNYFVDIFQSKPSHMAPVIDNIRQTISDEDNILLTSPFIKEEFREAIFSMNPDKCPGPDGYNPGFYQHFWSLCSDDIFKDCCY
jgi:hypothetical protein